MTRILKTLVASTLFAVTLAGAGVAEAATCQIDSAGWTQLITSCLGHPSRFFGDFAAGTKRLNVQVIPVAGNTSANAAGLLPNGQVSLACKVTDATLNNVGVSVGGGANTACNTSVRYRAQVKFLP